MQFRRYYRFHVQGVLYISAVMVLVGWTLSALLDRLVTAREWEMTTTLAWQEAKRADLYTLLGSPTKWLKAAVRKRAELATVVHNIPEAVQLSVWNRDGVVLWADRSEAIGQRLPENPLWRQALAGQVGATLRRPGAGELRESLQDVTTLAELYIPLFAKGSGEVQGGLHLLTVPTRLLDTLYWGRLAIITALVVSGLVIYGGTRRFAAIPTERLEAAVLRQTRALQRQLAETQDTVQAIRDSEARARLLSNSNPHPMWVYDVHTLAFLTVNDTAVQHYGYTHDEFLALTTRDVLVLEMSQDLPGLVTPRLGPEGRPPVERHRKKDGTIIEVRSQTRDLVYAGREAQLVLVQDITAQRRTALALAERTMRFQVVRDVTTEIARERDVKRLLQRIARRAVQLVGTGPGVILLWDDVAQVLRPQAWYGIDTWPLEHPIALGEGALGTVAAQRTGLLVNHYRTSPYAQDAWGRRLASTALVAEPLLFRDRLVGVIALSTTDPAWEFTVHDQDLLTLLATQAAIAMEHAQNYQTLEKLYTAEAEARQVAERAVRLKSEFLSNMSHELRTPLNGMLGMTALVLETPLTPEQHEYLSIVQTSGRDLLRLLNDLLEFAQIEAGELPLVSEAFHLRHHVEVTIQPLQLRAQAKGLRFRWTIAPAVPDILHGDAEKLRQVLTHLLENAIKFTNEGAITLTVALASPTAPAAEAPVTLRVTVQDTGIGIPPEQHQAIFESFTQADGSPTRVYGGTGLGLTLAKQLVASLGGVLDVESTVGAGSTFTFTACFSRGMSTAPPGEPSLALPVNLAQALRTVDGDAMLLAEIVRVFRDDYPQQLAHMRTALATRQGDEAALDAHRLKGSISAVGGTTAYTLVADLEQRSRAGEITTALDLVSDLERELVRIEVFFAQQDVQESG